jgi:hypothetical protein
MNELIKRAIIGMINKKSLIGLIIGALIVLAAQLSGLSVSEVQESVCVEKIEAPKE